MRLKNIDRAVGVVWTRKASEEQYFCKACVDLTVVPELSQVDSKRLKVSYLYAPEARKGGLACKGCHRPIVAPVKPRKVRRDNELRLYVNVYQQVWTYGSAAEGGDWHWRAYVASSVRYPSERIALRMYARIIRTLPSGSRDEYTEAVREADPARPSEPYRYE